MLAYIQETCTDRQTVRPAAAMTRTGSPHSSTESVP
jgi:hypothetical protein